MGARYSTLSHCDDLVVDHQQEHTQVMVPASKGSCKQGLVLVPETNGFSQCHLYCHPLSRCSSLQSDMSDMDISTVVGNFDAGAAAVSAETSVQHHSSSCSTAHADEKATAPVSVDAAWLSDAPAGELDCALENEATVAPASEDCEADSGMVFGIMPALDEATLRSIALAASSAREEDDDDNMFACELQEQQADKAEALSTLAAAAMSKGYEQLAVEERLALKESGKKALQTAAQKLTKKIEVNNKVVMSMGAKKKEMWFKKHAEQSNKDRPDPNFENEWANLNRKLRAKVAELHRRNGFAGHGQSQADSSITVGQPETGQCPNC